MCTVHTSTIPGPDCFFTEVTTSRVAPSAFRESKDAAAALKQGWSSTDKQFEAERVPCAGETVLAPAVVLGKGWPAVDCHQYLAHHHHLAWDVETPVQEIV